MRSIIVFFVLSLTIVTVSLVRADSVTENTIDSCDVDSDEYYQVILKFEGQPTLFYYGVFINYNIVKML